MKLEWKACGHQTAYLNTPLSVVISAFGAGDTVIAQGCNIDDEYRFIPAPGFASPRGLVEQAEVEELHRVISDLGEQVREANTRASTAEAELKRANQQVSTFETWMRNRR